MQAQIVLDRSPCLPRRMRLTKNPSELRPETSAPVQPCDTAIQPSFLATSIWALAMTGRARLVPRRYTLSYTALHLISTSQPTYNPCTKVMVFLLDCCKASAKIPSQYYTSLWYLSMERSMNDNSLFFDEFLPQILHVDFQSPYLQGLVFCFLKVLLLPDICAEAKVGISCLFDQRKPCRFKKRLQ